MTYECAVCRVQKPKSDLQRQYGGVGRWKVCNACLDAWEAALAARQVRQPEARVEAQERGEATLFDEEGDE